MNGTNVKLEECSRGQVEGSGEGLPAVVLAKEPPTTTVEAVAVETNIDSPMDVSNDEQAKGAPLDTVEADSPETKKEHPKSPEKDKGASDVVHNNTDTVENGKNSMEVDDHHKIAYIIQNTNIFDSPKTDSPRPEATEDVAENSLVEDTETLSEDSLLQEIENITQDKSVSVKSSNDISENIDENQTTESIKCDNITNIVIQDSDSNSSNKTQEDLIPKEEKVTEPHTEVQLNVEKEISSEKLLEKIDSLLPKDKPHDNATKQIDGAVKLSIDIQNPIKILATETVTPKSDTIEQNAEKTILKTAIMSNVEKNALKPEIVVPKIKSSVSLLSENKISKPETITTKPKTITSKQTITLKPDTFTLKPESFSLNYELPSYKPEPLSLKSETITLKPTPITSTPESLFLKTETVTSQTANHKSETITSISDRLVLKAESLSSKPATVTSLMETKMKVETPKSGKTETVTSRTVSIPPMSETKVPKKESTNITQKSEKQIANAVSNIKVRKGILAETLSSALPKSEARLSMENAVKAVENNSDIEMVEVSKASKNEPKIRIKVLTPEAEAKPVNGDVSKDEQSTKRRASDDLEADSPLKRLCQEVEKTFPHHDAMVNEYIQNATKNNVDEIQRHTEQLLAEIQTLRELAQKKEHEWNNILHLKKVKEEILLRLLRKKQVTSFEKAESDGERKDPFDYLNQAKSLAIDKSDEISGLALKQPMPIGPAQMMQAPMMPVSSHFNPLAGLPPPYDKVAHMQAMQKQVFSQNMMMAGPTMPGFPRDMNGQMPNAFGMPMGRQGPTKDVKSIIADYRQRNPDVTPRRGRRMKSILNPNMMNAPRNIAPKMDSLNNLNNLNNLGMIFNNLDMNQKAMLERLSQMQGTNLPNGMSFKDVLVQYASMQQPNMAPPRPEMMRPELRPEVRPDRPEVRQEPRRRQERHQEEVQISVKERTASPRLPPPPPYPEISLLPVNQEGASSQQNSLLHGILTKNCGEITITPVAPTAAPEPPPPTQDKTEEVVQLDDEESPPSEASNEEEGGPRLVIDEGEAATSPAEEAPLCQGCRRRPAQFVCAGCANQWYCSRDCQVAAWDDHSDMCSG